MHHSGTAQRDSTAGQQGQRGREKVELSYIIQHTTQKNEKHLSQDDLRESAVQINSTFAQ